MSYVLLGQIIGLIATCFSVYSMTHKSDKRLKVFSAIGSGLFVSHYLLIGEAIVWAVMNVLGVAKAYFSINHNKYVGIILIFAYISVGIIFYDRLMDIIPIFAGILSSIWLFFFKGTVTRLLLISDSCIWLTYNLYVGSWGGTITETCMLIILTYNVLKHHKEIQEINT